MKNCLKLLCLLCIFISTIQNSQAEYRSGSIVKNNGDTINGQIDYRGDQLMGRECHFKSENNLQIFYPNDILSFKFTNGKHYISKNVNDKARFLEYLINGVIDLFYIRQEDKEYFYIERAEIPLREITYEEHIRIDRRQDIEGKRYLYKSQRHKAILKIYLYDAPSLEKTIDNMAIPTYNNLSNLINEYHEVYCNGENCISYKKSAYKFKISIAPTVGIVKFSDELKKDDSFNLQGGMFLNFWLPRLNESLYIKSGFLVSNPVNEEGNKSSYTKLYFDLAYLPNNSNLIKPTFSIGLFDRDYSGGVMIKLTDKMDLGIIGSLQFDQKSLPWAPSDLETYSINIGLKFNIN
jgi:hypothetical protein